MTTIDSRAPLVRRALHLEYATVSWNIIEGIVAVGAALAAGSVALLGFGVDSFVETASGAILIWRLQAEQGAHDEAAVERLDRRAHRLVGISLFVLAGYIALEAGRAFWLREQPDATLVGIAVTSLSIGAMWWLARAKRTAAMALGSRALAADTFQTSACFWLTACTCPTQTWTCWRRAARRWPIVPALI